MESRCEECGAQLIEGKTCYSYFEQMLSWDFADFREAGREHHLTVLCYHLQHPSRYSLRGLVDAKEFLAHILDHGLDITAQYRRSNETLSSEHRNWKIAATPTDHGAYAHPITWAMTAYDVVHPGLTGYPERVREWAYAIYSDLKKSGNLGA